MDYKDFIRDHSACTEGICSASQVNEETYETQHVEDGCRCELGRPSAADLRPILESGLIPVLSFRFGHDGTFSGIGVACSDDMPYVAISHVWADGLGNMSENGLPICQLRRLQSLVERLRDEKIKPDGSHIDQLAIWIDTLCIPVQRELRKAAIAQMGQVYHEAAAVLVLDPGLYKSSCATAIEETLMRIECCRWMRRLWTFQEGVLPRRVFVQFADGLRDLIKTIQRLEVAAET
jgi:hypothetical protein